jgi:hypothetical protein
MDYKKFGSGVSLISYIGFTQSRFPVRYYDSVKFIRYTKDWDIRNSNISVFEISGYWANPGKKGNRSNEAEFYILRNKRKAIWIVMKPILRKNMDDHMLAIFDLIRKYLITDVIWRSVIQEHDSFSFDYIGKTIDVFVVDDVPLYNYEDDEGKYIYLLRAQSMMKVEEDGSYVRAVLNENFGNDDDIDDDEGDTLEDFIYKRKILLIQNSSNHKSGSDKSQDTIKFGNVGQSWADSHNRKLSTIEEIINMNRLEMIIGKSERQELEDNKAPALDLTEKQR